MSVLFSGCGYNLAGVDRIEVISVNPNILTTMATTSERFMTTFSDFEFSSVMISDRTLLESFSRSIEDMESMEQDAIINVRGLLKFYEDDVVLKEVYVGRRFSQIGEKKYQSSKEIVEFIESLKRPKLEILPMPK